VCHVSERCYDECNVEYCRECLYVECYVMLYVMLSAIMLSVIVLISVILSIVISFHYYMWYQTECRNTEFCYSKFLYAEFYLY